MKKWILAAALIVACGTSYAGNSNGCQGNCPSDGGGATATGGNATGGNGYGGNGYGTGGDASAVGVGLGVGVGYGGEGGKGGAGGAGGNASAVGLGGSGGAGGSVHGSGNSNNRNDATAISGSVSGADSASVSGADAKATATNGGNTITNGAVTQQGGAVSQRGGDTNVSYRTERNAPPVYLGQLTATMSCSGSFNAGSSSQGGSGAFGFTWISGDCRSVVTADKFRELGMVDTSCKILKTTKGFKRAAKANPELANIDCTAK